MSHEEIDRLMVESQNWSFLRGSNVPPRFDCQGFCLLVLKRFKMLPESFEPLTATDWREYVTPISKPEPMCIVMMERELLHMGIAVDKYSFLHFTRQGLCLSRIYEPKLLKTIRGYYKVD